MPCNPRWSRFKLRSFCQLPERITTDDLTVSVLTVVIAGRLHSPRSDYTFLLLCSSLPSGKSTVLKSRKFQSSFAPVRSQMPTKRPPSRLALTAILESLLTRTNSPPPYAPHRISFPAITRKPKTLHKRGKADTESLPAQQVVNSMSSVSVCSNLEAKHGELKA